MTQAITAVPPPPPEPGDDFEFGWRFLPKTLPDGTKTVEVVPLKGEDLLYPEEGDQVVQTAAHTRDFVYLHPALETFYAAEPSVVVLGDHRVDWGPVGVRPLGPDILVLFDVREWLEQRATYRLAEDGGRPILVLEITSPSTYENDVGVKIELYYRVGVQLLVLIDRGPDGNAPATLRGFQRGPTGWIPLPVGPDGRINLAPVPLSLGLEGDCARLYITATGQPLPDRTELVQALALAATAVKQAKAQTQQANLARAAAEAQVQEADQARAVLESRLRELEDQLRRRLDQGPPGE